MVGIGFEAAYFVGCHRPALNLQRVDRSVRKLPVITRVDRAKVTFGGDVQANGLDDLGREMVFEKRRSGLFVIIVLTFFQRIDREVTDKMADIMQ